MVQIRRGWVEARFLTSWWMAKVSKALAAVMHSSEKTVKKLASPDRKLQTLKV
jgi:hypothetical protein